MATVPSSNATATRYAANGKDIWVPSQTINDITVGNKALPEALRSTYGKIFTTKPTTPVAGDLFYGIDNGHKVLQYHDGTSWQTIFDADMTGTIYETTVTYAGSVPTEAEKVEAAQAELYDKHASVGDIVIAHWTEGSSPAINKAESYICVGVALNPSQASDYTVAHTTSEDAKEVKYTGASGHIISTGTTVEECLQALDQASADFGRYILENATQSAALQFAYEGIDKSFYGYTGVLKFTCCIKCSAYVSTGIVTCAVYNGVIEAGSMSLADYYVKSLTTDRPDSNDMDIFDLDFEIDSTLPNKLIVTTSATKTVVSGTIITVKVQW